MFKTRESIRDGQDVQETVRLLFLGCAPERAAELSRMWHELTPLFQLTPDEHEGNRLILDAGAYRYVRFNHRIMRAFWTAGYAAWEGYRTVAESASVAALDLTRFNELISYFESVVASDELHLEVLPKDVPEPGQYADPMQSPQSRAAGELATIAVAWALLHEIQHIRHQREATGADPFSTDSKPKHDEELSCDRFATTFLLQEVDVYARQSGQTVDLVRQKRQLGIYFALFAIALLAKDRWGASDTHPAVQVRIDEVRAQMEPAKSVIAAALAHAAFSALQTQWPGAPNPY